MDHILIETNSIENFQIRNDQVARSERCLSFPLMIYEWGFYLFCKRSARHGVGEHVFDFLAYN